jgi:hypothetical protein
MEYSILNWRDLDVQSIELKKKRLVDRIREPDPVPLAYGRHAIRLAIKNAFQYLQEKPEQVSADERIRSEKKTIDAIIKRYSSFAVSRRQTGITRSEQELQEQLEWYRVMVPWIVKTEFNKQQQQQQQHYHHDDDRNKKRKNIMREVKV